MDTTPPKPLGSVVSGLLGRLDSWRKQPNSFPRMTISEAIEAINAIVNCYPNGGKGADDGYIGALASVLVDYPLSISLKAADPRRGVAAASKFLPTVYELIQWLDAESASGTPPPRAYPLLEPLEPMDRGGHLTYDELKSKYGDGQGGWGIAIPTKPARAETVAETSRRLDAVRAEWVGEPPTLGGIPVSVELARLMGLLGNAE